jgi:hypothetical protein
VDFKFFGQSRRVLILAKTWQNGWEERKEGRKWSTRDGSDRARTRTTRQVKEKNLQWEGNGSEGNWFVLLRFFNQSRFQSGGEMSGEV